MIWACAIAKFSVMPLLLQKERVGEERAQLSLSELA